MNSRAESSQSKNPCDEAAALYRAFLHKIPGAENVEFEKLCIEKVALADELRHLHSRANAGPVAGWCDGISKLH